MWNSSTKRRERRAQRQVRRRLLRQTSNAPSEEMMIAPLRKRGRERFGDFCVLNYRAFFASMAAMRV